MTSTRIGCLDGRRWRRLEKRAIVAHQRDLAAALRTLGDERTPVVGLEIVAGGTGTRLDLTLPEHRLALAGTAFGVCAELRRLGEAGSRALALSSAGRYGRAWWLTFTVGGDTVTVLGSHIRLIPDTYGDTGRVDGSRPAGCVVRTGSHAG